MQTHIITPRNSWFYSNQVQQIYRQRYELFVDELGWKELSDSSGLDIDEFDHDRVVYIAVIDDVGDVKGSCRMSPTLYKNLSTDKLSQFFDSDIPKGIDVWDCSRWVGGKGKRSDIYQIAGYMWIGLHEFCLNYGITSVTGVVSPKLMNMMLSLGLPVKPLSLPVEYDEGVASGVHIGVSTDSIEKMRNRFSLHQAVSIEITSNLQNRKVFTPLHFSALSHILDISDTNDLQRLIEFCSKINTSSISVSAQQWVEYFKDTNTKGIFQ